MTKYTLAIYSQCHEILYNPASASQLARVSLDFLRECEREGLIQPQMMPYGEYGYPISEIRQLARIRRLCDSLDLDLAAVGVILYLRQQVVESIEQRNQLEQQKYSREQELLNEIQRLRYRLADEVDWNAEREWANLGHLVAEQAGRAVGWLTLHDVKKILRVDWPHTTAAEAMIPAENMKRILPDVELVNALAEMDHDGVNQLPVMVGDQIQGVLCRDAAIGLLRTLSEFRRK